MMGGVLCQMFLALGQADGFHIQLLEWQVAVSLK